MATLFARHKVADYDTWRRAYDAFDAARAAAGCTHQGVYRSADDPNDVTIFHEFGSMDAAKSFAGSDQLKDAMMNAGVQGPPDIWFASRM